MKSTRLIGLFVVLIGLICCKDNKPIEQNRPEGVLSPDSMQTLLMEFHIAEAAHKTLRKTKADTSTPLSLYYRQLIAIHQVDSITFRTSMDYYKDHPAQLNEIYEDMLEEISKRVSKVEAKKKSQD